MSKNAYGQENKREPALTDDDIMPFGKYAGKKLIEVPADYYRWLWNDAEYPMRFARDRVTQTYLPVANYIWNSRHALNKELKKEEIT
jgi:hypothetical protein